MHLASKLYVLTNYRYLFSQILLDPLHFTCRPWWSQGNVLASRSKVRGFIPAEVNGFFHNVKILSTSPPGETLSWGQGSEISRSLKNLKPEKIAL